MSNFAKERLAICNSCVYNEDNSCILCSCELIEKTNNPNELCPLMPPKWSAQAAEMEKGAESTGQITAQPTPPPRPQRTVCIPCNRR